MVLREAASRLMSSRLMPTRFRHARLADTKSVEYQAHVEPVSFHIGTPFADEFPGSSAGYEFPARLSSLGQIARDLLLQNPLPEDPTPQSIAEAANSFMIEAASRLGIEIKQPREFDVEAIEQVAQAVDAGAVLAMRHFGQRPMQRTLARVEAVFDVFSQWESSGDLTVAAKSINLEALGLTEADLAPEGNRLPFADLFSALRKLREQGYDDQKIRALIQKVFMMREDANRSEQLTPDSLVEVGVLGIVLAGIDRMRMIKGATDFRIRFAFSPNNRAAMTGLAMAEVYHAASNQPIESAPILVNRCPNVGSLSQTIRIMGQNNGDFPWSQASADYTFGPGTWTRFHGESPNALPSNAREQARSLLAPNTLTISVEHTQGLTEQQIAAGISPSRLGNGGFLLYMGDSESIAQRTNGFFK